MAGTDEGADRGDPAAGPFDVVIVGGGCVGSAAAWHLLEMAPGSLVTG